MTPNGRDPEVFRPTPAGPAGEDDTARERPAAPRDVRGGAHPGQTTRSLHRAGRDPADPGTGPAGHGDRRRAAVVRTGPARREGRGRAARSEVRRGRSPARGRPPGVPEPTRGRGQCPGCSSRPTLCGLPVVATSVPGVRSIVQDGVTGLVVPRRRPRGAGGGHGPPCSRRTTDVVGWGRRRVGTACRAVQPGGGGHGVDGTAPTAPRPCGGRGPAPVRSADRAVHRSSAWTGYASPVLLTALFEIADGRNYAEAVSVEPDTMLSFFSALGCLQRGGGHALLDLDARDGGLTLRVGRSGGRGGRRCLQDGTDRGRIGHAVSGDRSGGAGEGSRDRPASQVERSTR